MAKTSILLLNLVLILSLESLVAFKLPHYINFITNKKEHSGRKQVFDPLVINLTQCAHVTQAGIVEVENYIKRLPQKTPAGKCFIACMYKKANILRNNKISPLDVTAAYSLTHADDTTLMNDLKTALHECLKYLDSSGDACEYSSVFSECMNTKIGPVIDAEAKEIEDPRWETEEVEMEEQHILNRVKARL